MSVLLRRPTRQQCFYCQTQVDPQNPRSFVCPACQCWNRYDARGEILSDEPAMHDENLNAKSFARRASPRKDRLPTAYGKGVFCHTCQTNQMLLSNLLSNYLPPPTDPEYASRLSLFDAYRDSIEVRYPSVCAQCQPAVEEEIRKRDQMARTSALGAFLKDSRGKGKQRQVSNSQKVRKEQFERALVCSSFFLGTLPIWQNEYGADGKWLYEVATEYRFASIPRSLAPIIPAIVAISLFWTAWDPTFATIQRHKLQGRSMRQRGKKEYNILQITAWLSRLMSSIVYALPTLKPSWNTTLMQYPTTRITRIYCYAALVLETLILIRSLLVLRVQKPPPVHLLNSRSGSVRLASLSPPPVSQSSSRGVTPQVQAEPDLLASLTLSNQPVFPSSSGSTTNPIFGLPSLRPNHHQQQEVPPNGDTSNYDMDDMDEEESEKERDPNAMDWTPTSSPAKRNKGAHQNGNVVGNESNSNSWLLRPQRFFAPEEPTGLETLFARTISLSDLDQPHTSGAGKNKRGSFGTRQPWYWGVVIGVAVVPLLAAVAYKIWEPKRGMWVPVEDEWD